MIKMRFLSNLGLSLAAGCLSVGMLAANASAQVPTPLVTVVIGDSHSKNMGVGAAARLLVSDVCGVNERDAQDILAIATNHNQKIVAICPKTGAVFHVIP